jgi:virulence factor Mce-like protein
MSEILFPHVRKEARRALRLRLALIAVVAGSVFAGFSLWLGGSYVGLLGGDVVATARVVTLGDSLGVNSSVKFRGLRVGRVVSVDSTRDKDGLYSANVVIEDKFADQIPSSVVTRVVPGTLFGAEFVDLHATVSGSMGAAAPGHATVRDGTVFAADTSAEGIRLMDTFSALYRVIDAVDPAAMDMAMSQLSGALDGRGKDLHQAVGRISALVDDYAAVEPAFYRDLELLASNLDMLADVEPDLAATLRNSIPVAQTIATKAADIEKVIAATTALSARLATFLEAHGPTLDRFLADVAPTYRAFVNGRDAFTRILQFAPGVLRNGATAVSGGAIQMLAKFSAQARAPYTSADCPRYGSLRGRNCR